MTISRVWIAFALMTGVLMALVSAAGLFLPVVYAKETASWAAQGAGQDLVNLVVAFPVLLVSSVYVRRGSVRALMVWLGALVYVVYSYVVYAFAVHFGPTFLLYVATLGLSAYALIGSATSVDLTRLERLFPPHFRRRSAAVFFLIVGAVFSALWLTAIGRALAASTPPPGVAETGLPVNPIHVLDLAFLLPLTIATGVWQWKGRPIALLLTTPLLVFFALMDVAIISMTFFMRARGVPASMGIVPVMGVGVLVSLWLTWSMLRAVRPAGRAA